MVARGDQGLEDRPAGAVASYSGLLPVATRVERLVEGQLEGRSEPARGGVARQHPQRGRARPAAATRRRGRRTPRRPTMRSPGRDGTNGATGRRRGVQRRLGDVEVGVVGVVDDQQPVTRGLDVVLDPLAAGGHHPRRRRGVVGVEQADLGGQLGAAGDDEEPVVAGGARPDPEPLVGLLEDQHVVARRACRPRAATPGTAATSRPPGEEEVAPVGDQTDAVADVGRPRRRGPSPVSMSLIRSAKRSSPSTSTA